MSKGITSRGTQVNFGSDTEMLEAIRRSDGGPVIILELANLLVSSKLAGAHILKRIAPMLSGNGRSCCRIFHVHYYNFRGDNYTRWRCCGYDVHIQTNIANQTDSELDTRGRSTQSHGETQMTPNKDYLLNLLSGNDVTFFIPPYQRNYEWDDSQCDVFFKDVTRVAIQNASGVRAEHFIGMLVYVQERVSFGQPAKLVLVDGQQRITTTMLFLMAMRDEIDDPHIKLFIDNRYLKNNNVTGTDEHKVKLKQVETDWPAYLHLVMGGPLSANEEQTRVAKNYRRFRKNISAFKRDNEMNLSELIELGLGKLSVVTILLEPEQNPWENPQEVFESMNSLGKPLSLADLVRNWLLMGKPADEQEKLYHTWWLPMEHELGASGQVSNFIRDYMQLLLVRHSKRQRIPTIRSSTRSSKSCSRMTM